MCSRLGRWRPTTSALSRRDVVSPRILLLGLVHLEDFLVLQHHRDVLIPDFLEAIVVYLHHVWLGVFGHLILVQGLL